MTETVIPNRFLVRGGTAANLVTVNEVLKARELCFETDTGKWKMGDGATAWNSLAYRGTVDDAITNGVTNRAPSQNAVFDALALKADTTYVDALVAGLSWKQAVRASTVAAGTLATDFENGDTIDGVVLATNDRILVKNQAAPADNGIYTVNASGAPTRALDANTGAELVNASVYVSEGTTLADTQWTCTTNAPITVGVTSLAFAQLATGGGSTPTGTGFTHITAGVQDAAAKLVDTADISADAVTYAKMQNVSAASKLLGRGSASGSGDVEEITLGTGLTMTGTTLAASGGSGISSGSSNPGSPSDGDLFYRTDLGLLIRYYSTGTRWLTVNEYSLNEQILTTITTSGTRVARFSVPSDYAIYLTRWNVTLYVVTTNSGSNYWNATLESLVAAGTATSRGVANTSASVADNLLALDVNVDTALATTAKELEITMTKTGAPGALVGAFTVNYRKIIT